MIKTDTELLDWLQERTTGIGWVCRPSIDGLGWRLHEVQRDQAEVYELYSPTTPRQAIEDAIWRENDL